MGIFIKLLGGPVFYKSDGSTLQLPTRKSEALLAYLLERGGELVSRDALSGKLWPYSGEEQARASLRQEISVLRKGLGASFSDIIIIEGDRIGVSKNGLDVDIWRLRSHRQLGHDPHALLALFELYSAPFLDTFRIRSQPFTDWVWATRQSLETEILSLGQATLLRCVAEQDHGYATQIAMDLCRIEPTYEPAHQALIKTHIRNGDMASAQRQLHQCEHALKSYLDVPVSAETLALFQGHNDGLAVTEPIKELGSFRPTRQRRFVTALKVVANLDIADPEDFDREVEDVITPIQSLIEAKGGTILRAFDGDILAFFGYPIGHDTDPDTATFAALDILETLNAKTEGATQVQIGLSYGQVLISGGVDGASSRPDVSGSVLRTCETVARQGALGSVTMCRQTAKIVSPSIGLKPLDDLSGSQHVLPRHETALPEQPEIFVDHGHPMLGRDDQLAHMLNILEQAKQGNGGVAAILGDPGQGKSRLVHEVIQKGISLGFNIEVFQGRKSAQKSAFAPVLDQMYRKNTFKTDQPTRQELEGWLMHRSPNLPLAAPYFEELIKSFNAQRSEKTRVTDAEKQAALNIFSARHTAPKDHNPTIMVFEDTQWFDPTTCDAIARLIDVVSDAPAFVVLVSRLGEAPTIFEHPFVQKIILAPLQLRSAEALLRGLLGATSTSAPTIKNVLERAEGNPLTLEEFAKAIVFQQGHSMGHISLYDPTDAHLKTDTPIGTPTRLLPLLLSRIDAVPGAIQTLQYACVFGRRFSNSNLAQVLKPARANEQLMKELVEAGILFPVQRGSETDYIFKHALIGEAIYSTIPKGERPMMHVSVAEVLVTDGKRVNHSRVAHHYKSASKHAEAAQYFELSGDHATGLSAHSESISEYHEALQLVEHLPSDANRLRLELTLNNKIAAQMIAQRGIPTADVTPYFEKALALSEILDDANEIVNAVWVGWSIHLMAAKMDQCLEVAVKLAPTVKKLGTPITYVIEQYMLGVTQTYRGDLQAAAAHFEAIQGTYSDDMKEKLMSRFSMDIYLTANSFSSWVYALLGQSEDADAATRRSLQMAQKNANGLSHVFANVFAAMKCLILDDIDGARRHAEPALTGADEMGFTQWSAQAKIQLARVADLSGDSSALEVLKKTRLEYLATGVVLARPYMEIWIAEAQIRQGLYQGALDTLDELGRFVEISAERYYDFARLQTRDIALAGILKTRVTDN